MQSYDASSLGPQFGLQNYGSTCYFNTLVQSLLSCPVLHQTLKLIESTDEFKKSQAARALLKLFTADQDYQRANRELITCIFARNPSLQEGQQDVSEAFMTLMDLLERVPEIYKLFQHRYCTLIFCMKCEKVVSKVEELSTIIEVQSDLKSEQAEEFANIDPQYAQTQQLNDFILKTNTSTDKDFKCPECKSTDKKFKSTKLQMVPEILPVLIKKYDGKPLTQFPEFLEFPSKTRGTKLVYHLVSQCEHIGGQNGGHYWAICRRDRWMQFNDSYVAPDSFGPRPTTYMLLYCYLETRDM